jgi:hypothetical protein
MLRRLAGIAESYTLAVGYLIDMFAREWPGATSTWQWLWQNAPTRWQRTLCLYVLVVLAEGGRGDLIDACLTAATDLSLTEQAYVDTILAMVPDGAAEKWGRGLWEGRSSTDLIMITPDHELVLELPRKCCTVVKIVEPCTSQQCRRHAGDRTRANSAVVPESAMT